MFNSVRENLKKHYVVVVLAFLVSLIHGAHHLVLPDILSEQSRPYYPTLIGVDERYHSIPKAKEVFLTGKASGDISIAEYADTPAFLPPVPYYGLGSFAKITGSMTGGLELADFLIPPIIFILFYILAFEIVGMRIASLIFASLSIFIPRYLAYVPLFTKYYQAWYLGQFFNPQYRLYFNRFEDPLFTVPLFLIALILIFKAMKTKRRFWTIAAGVAYGVLFYTYFYYMAYLSAALGIGLILFLIAKRFKDAKTIGTILGIGLVLSIPYWINFFEVTSLPAYTDISARIGPEHTYDVFLYPMVLFAYAQHTGLAVLMYLLYRKKNPTFALLFPALLLPVFFVYNFQIITGFNPQPDHWIKPRQFLLTLTFIVLGYEFLKNRLQLFSKKTVIPLSLIAAALLSVKALITKDPAVTFEAFAIAAALVLIVAGYFVLKKWGVDKRRFITLLSIIAIAVLFAKGATIKREYIFNNMETATLEEADDKSIQWLEEHTPEGSVVSSLSFVTNTLIKHFTHNKLFVPDGLDTIASNAEIMERFSYANRIQGVRAETFGSYFARKETYPPKDEDHEGISFLFTDQYRAREKGSIFTNKGYLFPLWSAEEHAKVVNDYRTYLEKEIPDAPYRLDYIYWGDREKIWSADPILSNPDLILEYNVAGVKIYRLP